MNTLTSPLSKTSGSASLCRKFFKPRFMILAITLAFSFLYSAKSYAGNNPVIILKGDTGLLDTMKVEQGYPYIEPGDSAHSDLYGDITKDIIVTSTFVGGSGSFNNLVVGTYIFSYDVTDPVGNKAPTRYRVVRVTPDKTPPNLVIAKNKTSGTDTIYYEVTTLAVPPNLNPSLRSYIVSSTDLVDGNVTGSVVIDSSFVQLTVVDIYPVTYSSTDLHGNKAVKTLYVDVIDTIKPVITIKGANPDSVEVYTPFVDPGVVLSVSNNYLSKARLARGLRVTSTVDDSVPGTYTVTYNLTDTFGNVAKTVSRIVVVYNNNISKGSTIDTTVCKGSCPVFTAHPTIYAYPKYLWSTGDTIIYTSLCPVNHDTTMSLTVTDSGRTSSVTFYYNITVPKTSCVWPGDANGDGVADKNDVLAIGVAYGDSGAKRDFHVVSLNWVGQPCNDWANSFKSGVNHKNADCNGDGSVDSTDMAAVSKNYGYTHNKTNGANGGPTDPPLSIAFSKDSVMAGDTVTATISLGSSTIPVKNAYGLAFSIPYNFFYVKPGKATVNLSNCWLGTRGKDLIYFLHDDSANNVIDFAVTRIDHKDVSGYGELGQVSIVMQDNLGGKTWVNRKVVLKPSDVKFISADETPIPLYATGDSNIVTGPLSGINNANLAGRFKLYPNPTSQNIFIDGGSQEISGIQMIDELGKQVFVQTNPQKGIIEVPVSGLNSGIYTIIISTKNGPVARQVLKN